MQGPPLTAKEPHEKNDHRQDGPGQGREGTGRRSTGPGPDQRPKQGGAKRKRQFPKPSAPPCWLRPPRPAETEERRGPPRSAPRAPSAGAPSEESPSRSRAGSSRLPRTASARPNQIAARPSQNRIGAGESDPPRPAIKRAARGAWTSNATRRRDGPESRRAPEPGCLSSGRV